MHQNLTSSFQVIPHRRLSYRKIR